MTLNSLIELKIIELIEEFVITGNMKRRDLWTRLLWPESQFINYYFLSMYN